MNVSEVITRVKRQFGDESGVQITDADVIRWINDAQNDIGQAQEILETTAVNTSVAGQGNYTIPDDIINLRSVHYDGSKLVAVSMQDYDIYVRNWQDDPNSPKSGIPDIFYVWATEINLFPIPANAGIEIKLFYSQFPQPVNNSADELTLPIKWHNRIVEYCLQQAYELDENFEASNLKGSQMSASLTQMAEDASWTEHAHYPMVTVLPEDL